jgi:hypothetical protein
MQVQQKFGIPESHHFLSAMKLDLLLAETVKL